jgi:predicted nucleotidyltransferase
LKERGVDGRLTLDYVLPRLRKLFEGLEDVEIAVLFGSITRKRTGAHDVDIALRLRGETFSRRGAS